MFYFRHRLRSAGSRRVFMLHSIVLTSCPPILQTITPCVVSPRKKKRNCSNTEKFRKVFGGLVPVGFTFACVDSLTFTPCRTPEETPRSKAGTSRGPVPAG